MQYAIIGAGIGGLTTALAFEKLGIDYQVYERAASLNEVGAGIWLAPNALQVMEWLGLLAKVQKQGHNIDRITLARPDLRPFSDNDQAPYRTQFGFSTVAIHRARLQRLLFERVPSEKIHLGKGLQRWERNQKGGCHIRFADQRIAEAERLIGADGIHSLVRQQLFPDAEKRYSGQTCHRGIAAMDLPDTYRHRGVELWGKNNRIGFSQVGSGPVYWFAVAESPPDTPFDPRSAKVELLDAYRDYHELVIKLLAATPPENILKNDIWDLKPMERLHQGSICLVGDAAHATTPNMGQGGAQAIEDAYYLAHCVKKDPDSAFPAFQAMRQAKVNRVVRQSWQTGKMAHWKFGRGLRNIILSQMPKSFLHKQLMELYSIDRSFM